MGGSAGGLALLLDGLDVPPDVAMALLEEIIAEHTGQEVAKVKADTDRDYILSADEAVAYGIVDEVISSRKLRPGLTAAAAGGK